MPYTIFSNTNPIIVPDDEVWVYTLSGVLRVDTDPILRTLNLKVFVDSLAGIPLYSRSIKIDPSFNYFILNDTFGITTQTPGGYTYIDSIFTTGVSPATLLFRLDTSDSITLQLAQAINVSLTKTKISNIDYAASL